jgi:hypothetical protein
MRARRFGFRSVIGFLIAEPKPSESAVLPLAVALREINDQPRAAQMFSLGQNTDERTAFEASPRLPTVQLPRIT